MATPEIFGPLHPLYHRLASDSPVQKIGLDPASMNGNPITNHQINLQIQSGLKDSPGIITPPDPEKPEQWLLEALSLSIRNAQFRGSYMKDGLHFGVQCGIKVDGGFLVKSYGLKLFREEKQVFYLHPIRWFHQKRGKFYPGEPIDYSHNPRKVQAITAMCQMFMEWIEKAKVVDVVTRRPKL